MKFSFASVKGSASYFHQLHASPPSRRSVTLCRLAADTMVLGSSQKITSAQRDYALANNLELCRRASGGTGVIAMAGEVLWIDVGLPPNDPMLNPDVSRSFDPIAQAWMAGLGALGVDGSVAHLGPMRKSESLHQLCFAGLAPGEITVGGRKLVGMSQRRSGHGAYFHTMAYIHFPIAASVAAFAQDQADAEALLATRVVDLATLSALAPAEIEAKFSTAFVAALDAI